MSAKKEWKKFGKNTGRAFTNFGKAVATTLDVVVNPDDNTVNEDGETKLRESWKKTGKGFGEAEKL